MFTYPYTLDLNISAPRRRSLERLCQLWSKMYIFAKNSVSNCSFKTMQDFFSINSMCLAADISKRSGIQ